MTVERPTGLVSGSGRALQPLSRVADALADVASPERLDAARRVAAELGPDPDAWGESAADAAERRARAEQHKLVMWEDRVPPDFTDARLDRLQPQQDPDHLVSSYLDSDRLNLVLAGPVGKGKSHALHAVGWAARARGLSVVAYTAPMLSEIAWVDRHDDSTTHQARRTAIREVHRADLLVIDDVWKEKPDRVGVFSQFMWELTNHRVTHRLRTAFSVNPVQLAPAAGEPADAFRTRLQVATAAELRNGRYGAATGRRILDPAQLVWIDGEDLAPAAWNPFTGNGRG